MNVKAHAFNGINKNNNNTGSKASFPFFIYFSHFSIQFLFRCSSFSETDCRFGVLYLFLFLLIFSEDAQLKYRFTCARTHPHTQQKQIEETILYWCCWTEYKLHYFQKFRHRKLCILYWITVCNVYACLPEFKFKVKIHPLVLYAAHPPVIRSALVSSISRWM